MNRRFLGLCLLTLFGLYVVLATPPARQRKSTPRRQSDSRVHLLHADKLYYDEYVNRNAQFLVGNVKFQHEGTLMYCDSALYYEASNSFDAFGHVRMLQGDTLSLTGDVLYYSGLDQLARVRHNVVLKHREMVIYTDSLDYDRLYNLGYFFEGGKLLDQGNQLTSDWGEYNPATREAVFNYNVKLLNPAPPAETKTTLISDTLHYNTQTGIAHIVGPSNIEHGESHIYSESGYYNTQTDNSYLLDRSILTDSGKKLIGDSVVWDSELKVGKAFGNAEFVDVVNKNMFFGNYAYYDDANGYAEAADSAILMDFSQGPDTMYVHADSFKVYTYFIDTDSMYRTMHGIRHVRAYRNDLQAVCDSLVYNSKDSCMVMYYDPILWQLGQQLVGEEIRAFLNDSTVDSVQVLRQALSVERIDSVHYNQATGDEMHSYFRDGEIYLTTLDGNVLVNYYPFDDDSLMIGMNHVETSELKLYMADRRVQKIWMPAASGTIYPLFMIPPEQLYLDNFAWFEYIRPQDKSDIFNWRTKKAGSELKESVRHEAPKQRLNEISKKRKKKAAAETEEEKRDKPQNEPQEATTTSEIAETQTEEKVEETVNVEQKEE
ncbi:MAG: hypothetical protein J5661_02120 [Bacteroidaceae bacterium]|nr:hypothetical protein [Bacteroidaceae bacterium]